MKTQQLALGVVLALAVSVSVIAQSANELYQRALVQEHAKGDLKQAIALYGQAVQAAGKDRPLAAKALIRKAGLQEKLGANGDAQKTYVELLRAYPEQRTEVAVAQKRLNALRRAPSPGFIDRAPLPVEQASDTELAVRLARFLWSDAPDDLLLDAALRGDLHNPRGLNRQVLRMLRDPRSTILVDTFFTKWLALDSPKKVRSDAPGYPPVDPQLLRAMETETRLFLTSQLQEDRDAVELWTAPYTYVNDRLARHYGLPRIPGTEFRRVTWQNPNRAGLLGQAGVLTALSMASRTSPTKRGIFVMTRYLGVDAPPPPLNIPGLAESTAAPMRDRMTAHRTNPECAKCHAMFDPIGFALENFDADGSYRTKEGGQGGVPIDASSTLWDGTQVNGVADLRQVLLKYSPQFVRTVTEKLMTFALGRGVENEDMPVIRAIVRDAHKDNDRFLAILMGIVKSDPFQMRVKQAEN